MFWKFVRLKNPLPVKLKTAIKRYKKITAQFFATGMSSLELPLSCIVPRPLPANSNAP